MGPGVRMALSLFVTAATGQVPLPLSPSSIPVEKVQEAAVQTGSVSNQSSFLISLWFLMLILMLIPKVVIVVHLDIVWPQDIGLAHITVLSRTCFILVRVLF